MILTSITLKGALTLLILVAAIYSFISERLPPDVTALLAIIALLLTGVLTPTEAFAGFSHPATVSVAAVLVLSAGIERTGVLSFLARRLLAPIGHSELLLTIVIMFVIGGLSAFINNTAAVAIFIPVVLEVCRRTGSSPGRIMMPMSHAATLGGMCTLIGTSTNLVSHEYARSQGLPGFSMFELGRVGLPVMLAGFLYMLLIGRWFLPRSGGQETFTSDEKYLAELLVKPGSSWIGREINRDNFERDYDLALLGLERAGRQVSLNEPFPLLVARDSLRVRGQLNKVMALAAREGLELHRPEASKRGEPQPEGETQPEEKLLAEVVILTSSGLIGQTLKRARFAERYKTVVLALRRRGAATGRPSTMPLHAGDVLVVEGDRESLKVLDEAAGFLVIGTPAVSVPRTGKLIITLFTLVAVVTLVSFGVIPIVTAATAGCAVLMLTGCLRPREAYQAIDLSIVFLLAGSLALGAALEKAGLTTALANLLVRAQEVASPFVVMAGFFLVSVIISEFMSNSGTVPLLAPIAVSVAAKLGLNPTALLVAITFGSSAAFAMPIGYQTSLMIYGPGGYRFKDFIRMGIVLDLLVALLALWLIPKFWPLTSP
ncbi:MAG: SLC13 family permease [Acidobacteria bacterium]|nr:SLC13 family permease [Acidobacteriota bacterium]